MTVRDKAKKTTAKAKSASKDFLQLAGGVSVGLLGYSVMMTGADLALEMASPSDYRKNAQNLFNSPAGILGSSYAMYYLMEKSRGLIKDMNFLSISSDRMMNRLKTSQNTVVAVSALMRLFPERSTFVSQGALPAAIMPTGDSARRMQMLLENN